MPLDLDFVPNSPQDVVQELNSRNLELTGLQEMQTQLGTTVPQLFSTLGKFVSNPSSVSVETYKRMLDTDETIGSGIDFMNLAMIARWGAFKHPDPEIEDFINRAINNMDGSWHEYLDEMLSAEWAGFSVTEMVMKFEESFAGGPAMVPKELVTLPPLTIIFACDPSGKVLPDGVYQYQRYFGGYGVGAGSGYGFNLNQDTGLRPDLFAARGDLAYPLRISADQSYMTIKIPRDKVIHLRSTSTGKFSNPYGRPILRRIYKSWIAKDANLKMWIIAQDRKGTPLTVCYVDAYQDTVGAQNGMDGGAANARADVAMAQVLNNVHNSSYIVVPGKKGEGFELEAIPVQGDMNIYKDAVEYYNKSIMRGLLIPPLAMSSGDGTGSYALGESHQKIFKGIIDGKLKVYKQGVLSQFIQKIIALNFPKYRWEKHGWGDFVLEEDDPELMERLSNVFSTLTTANYIGPDSQADMDFVRAKLGLPIGPKREMPEQQDPEGMTGGLPGMDEEVEREAPEVSNHPGVEDAFEDGQDEVADGVE